MLLMTKEFVEPSLMKEVGPKGGISRLANQA